MGRMIEGHLNGDGLRVGIAVARFNALVGDRLLGGAIDTLVRHGVAEDAIDVVRVPGAFELPGVARRLTVSGNYEAVLCLGAVVRGDTPHFDHVCQGAARGIAEAAMEGPIPVLFGVLTTDTMEQALDRAGGKAGNKGAEIAANAIEMANLYRQLRGKE